jgi:uncharacterized membrane protein
MLEKEYCIKKLKEVGDRIVGAYKWVDKKHRREIWAELTEETQLSAETIAYHIVKNGGRITGSDFRDAVFILVMRAFENYILYGGENIKPFREVCEILEDIDKELFDDVLDEIKETFIKSLEEYIW